MFSEKTSSTPSRVHRTPNHYGRDDNGARVPLADFLSKDCVPAGPISYQDQIQAAIGAAVTQGSAVVFRPMCYCLDDGWPRVRREESA